MNYNPNRITKHVDKFEHEQKEPITWKDIKSFPLEDDWIINIDEDYDDYQAPYKLWAHVVEEESDEEYAARLVEIKRINSVSFQLHQEQRYQQYLRLKKEFENE